MTSAECFRCGEPATIKFGNGYLCEDCTPDSDGSQTTPSSSGSEPEERDHENPIDVSDVTNDERAGMLREYLEAFVAEFDTAPRLMPLDEAGKAPIIQGRCRLDSPEGREYLVDGEEAIRQIRDKGARGFAIYAGKRDHGTYGVAFVDHDDDSFPAPTGDPTLEVLSGSGRGAHETYRNDPDDPVANAHVGDNAGEVRAENWYVVAPGSVHPSGGVYHVVEDRDVATLADADLTDEMRPSTGRSDRDVSDDATAYDKDGEAELPDSDELSTRLEAAFSNPHDGEKIKQVYNGRYAAAGFSDRSGAEYWLANRLDSWVGLGSERTVRRVMNRGNLQKWSERTDRSYRDSILADVGRQDWYFDPDGDGSGGESEGDTADPAYGHGPEAEDCAPPAVDAEPFDREQRWAEFQGDRYEEWLDANRPATIWGDDAGSGKTTNAGLGAVERGRPHTLLFDKHEKAREFITDPVTPDDYFHLKGGEQPAHDCCMDATVRADEGERPSCPTHGDRGEWPRMNPIYERDPADDRRQRYEALLPVKGELGALQLLDEDGDLLEDNPWVEQFDGLENRKRVVGVHEYQQLKTAVGDRDLILDETPRLLSDTRRVTVAGLTSAALRLEDLADLPTTDEKKSRNLRALATFATDVRDAIAGDGSADLEDVDPPAIDWERFFELKDPMSGKGVNTPLKAETLAQLKLTYNETLVRRILEGDWNGEPFCIDTVLAAAAEAGLDDMATRQAIAVSSTLDSCPWCGGELANDNGARVCASEECSWHEAEHTVTRKDTDPARAIAWLEDPHGPDRAEHAGIVSTVLPPASDLPDPLVLDATATPAKVAAFYGEDDVDVRGDEPLDLKGKLRVTQVLDGQYHAQTIKDTPSLQSRIQSVIDTAGDVHDRPLFGIRGDLIPLFEFPENGEVLKYHAARGLNRAECDAVVCIGAPHPNIDDLERDAKLLAMGRDDVRVGGDEYSTRRDAPNPPVYRKLRYQDDDGSGVAVPTKHYTGLVGDLFREARENELVQFVHRIRPLLVDGAEPAKDAYLLTNVPTDLPVDDVAGFDELAGDLSAVFPVAEGALRLLEYAHDALEGDAPDGFRPGTLVEQREDGTIANKVAGWHRLATMNSQDVTRRTVRNWVDDLEAVGLLSPENYEQRRGVSFAADPATSKQALQVLSGNVGFEVAAVRRFFEKVRGVDGSLGWLEWAREALGLSGDRCEWGPPPDPVG